MNATTKIKPTREAAIRFTMSVLRHATDWQEGQDALSNDDTFGPWIRDSGADEIDFIQSIIREAEERLGDDLPY